MGVHADAVDANSLNPPLAVLYEVLYHVGVALVKVGHGRNKPSVNSFLQVYVGRIRVYDGGQLIVGLQVLLVSLGLCLVLAVVEPVGSVEPVLGRHVVNPRMLEAAVVEYHVHDNLQSL